MAGKLDRSPAQPHRFPRMPRLVLFAGRALQLQCRLLHGADRQSGVVGLIGQQARFAVERPSRVVVVRVVAQPPHADREFTGYTHQLAAGVIGVVRLLKHAPSPVVESQAVPRERTAPNLQILVIEPFDRGREIAQLRAIHPLRNLDVTQTRRYRDAGQCSGEFSTIHAHLVLPCLDWYSS